MGVEADVRAGSVDYFTRQALAAACRKRRITEVTVSTRVGCHPDWLSERISGRVPLSVFDLVLAAEVIGVNPGLLVAAGVARARPAAAR